MKTLKIYLGGKMSGLTYEEMNTWRNVAKHELRHMADECGVSVEVVNPVNYYNFKEPRHQSEIEVMNFDLSKVKSSDILLVRGNGLDSSIGTIIECYEAYKNGIPVLVYGKTEDYFKLHSWIQCCITRYENHMSDALEYIRDFYMM